MQKIDKIKDLIRKRSYDEAFHLMENLLRDDETMLFEICRLKSWAFSRQANYRSGWEAILPVVESEHALIADFHTAALWSLYDDQLDRSREWFLQVIHKGVEQNNLWFESSAYFYLAYIYAKLRDPLKAKNYLEMSGDVNNENRIVVPQEGALNRRELRKRFDL